MNLNFQCPSCKGVLQYEGGDSVFQNCRHCKGKIIVPSDVVHQHEQIQKGPTKREISQHRDIKLAEIQNELSAGRKINAIKVFRDTFGSDLATAKAAVDQLERGGPLKAGTPRPDQVAKMSVQDTAVETPEGTINPATPARIIFGMLRLLFFIAIIYWFIDGC